MSPLLDRQRQGVRLGAIRIGTKIVMANGKTRPEKLQTFRLTSADKVKIEAGAALYGGEVKPWKPNDGAGQQWEVVTTTASLSVRVPPGNPVEQNYEMWGATRQRLCDGLTERMKGSSCLCPADLMVRRQRALDGEACKPITRLSLILADLPGLGVWTLSSTGDSAADELAATAELLQRAELAGAMLPATLRLEQREQRGSGTLHRFAVPVLDVGVSLVALESGTFHSVSIGAGSQPSLPGPIAALPAAGPTSAQEVIVAARALTDPDAIQQLRSHARRSGWLAEYVEDTDGVSEPLDQALYAEFERAGGIA